MQVRNLASRAVSSVSNRVRPEQITIPLYIMTTPELEGSVREYWESHKYFGLYGQVYFFSQGRTPAMSREGQVLMKSITSLHLFPDGDGGVLTALHNSGACEDMEQRGVQMVQVRAARLLLYS